MMDRDGVINQPGPQRWIMHPNDLILEADAGRAIAHLNQRGVKVVVITNQSAIGQGLMSPRTLEKIHEKMIQELRLHGAHVDAIYVCPDAPDKATHRRKPNPGMIQEALGDFLDGGAGGASIPFVPFIGDSLTDIQAAVAGGCQPYLVLSGHGRRDRATVEALYPSVPIFPTLWDVVLSFDLPPKSDVPGPPAPAPGG